MADGMRSMADGFENLGEDVSSAVDGDNTTRSGMTYDDTYANYYSQDEYNTYLRTLNDANGIHDVVPSGVGQTPLQPATVPYRAQHNGVPTRINRNVTVYAANGQAMAQPSYSSPYVGPSLMGAPNTMPMQAQMPTPMPMAMPAPMMTGTPVMAGSPMFTGAPKTVPVQTNAYRVFFGPGGTKVTSRYQGVIKAVAMAYKANPVDSVIVEGHASKSGNPSANLKISSQRAVSVANELIKQGVPAYVITTRSHGEAKPSSYVSGMDHEQASRRAEIFIDSSSPVATGFVPPAPPVQDGYSAGGVPLLFGN
jgi:outer membrane protein OmpA-like peptidoglycan-associated protein